MIEVAIVGAAPTTRHLVNALPSHVERWGLNDLYSAGFLEVADRWFEMHSERLYDTTTESRRPAGHVAWLAAFQGPVYMLEPHADIPQSVRYPFEHISNDVGTYLTSTVAYMLALAIAERVDVIHIYGVDMAARGDYADQRPCCEYLIGLARGRGIRVELPSSSLLLTGPVYGMGRLNADGEHITDEQYANRLIDLECSLTELKRVADECQARMQRLEGAILETRFWANATPEGATQEVFAQYLGGINRG